MSRQTIEAIKRWKGQMVDKETGAISNIDSGKVYVRVMLDSSRNGEGQDGSSQFASGFVTEELKGVSPALIRRIEHIPLPFVAEIETQRVSNGRVSREQIVAITPVEDYAVKAGPSGGAGATNQVRPGATLTKAA